MKYTKGEWSLDCRVANRGGWDSDRQYINIICGDTLIAHYDTSFVEHPESNEENEANAKLMTASPELYEAAKAIDSATLYRGESFDNIDFSKLGQALVLLKKAIEKAESSAISST